MPTQTTDSAPCRRCHQQLPVESFVKDRSKASGYATICKSCDNARSKDYYVAHREKRSAYNRARYKQRPKTPPSTRHGRCVLCDTDFIYTGRPRKYCSPECFSTRPQHGTGTCPRCGNRYAKSISHQTYCGRDCAAADRSEREHAAKVAMAEATALLNVTQWQRCRLCPNYLKAGRGRLYCSDSCAWMWNNHADARTPVTCRVCDTTWQRWERPGRSVYCSDECSRAAFRDYQKVAKRRRKQVLRDQHDEPIYRRKVYERDNWTCRLCHEPVARDEQVPHPWAPTLDHITPLSLGGRHNYTNVQTAHFICNSRKGNRVDQLSFAA